MFTLVLPRIRIGQTFAALHLVAIRAFIDGARSRGEAFVRSVLVYACFAKDTDLVVGQTRKTVVQLGGAYVRRIR
jgi:hypothetical protein